MERVALKIAGSLSELVAVLARVGYYEGAGLPFGESGERLAILRARLITKRTAQECVRRALRESTKACRDLAFFVCSQWIDMQSTEAYASLNAEKMFCAQCAAARELGFRDTLEMLEILHGVDASTVASIALTALETTSGAYERLLAAGNQDENAGARVQRLLGDSSVDDQFSGAVSEHVAREALTRLGIGNLNKVVCDFEPRQGKQARGFCCSGSETDNYVVVAGKAGLANAETLLHELSHGARYANIEEGRPWPERYLGECSSSEGFAFIFDFLFSDSDFLIRYIPQDLAIRASDISRKRKLVMLRQISCSALFSIEGSRFAERASQTHLDRIFHHFMGYRPSRSSAANIARAWFMNEYYVRGWFFALGLSRFLERTIGKDWYQQRAAGSVILSLWRYGSAKTLRELESISGGPRDCRDLLLSASACVAS